jgi:alpha-L-rhamnosidase
MYTGDKEFLEDVYTDVLDVLAFVEGRLSEDGMFIRQKDDWVFMDWSTFDSDGPMCAEQILLARAYEAVETCAIVKNDSALAKHAKERAEYVKGQVNKLYWNNKKGAFVDSYTSGRENVTRHANIFAILFNLTTPDRVEKIVKNVIYNKEITPITTPYFEFYELDAMCKIGDFEYMTNMLDSYWGGMLRLGATTIWEEFDPTKSGIEHYEMYGGKYEKSLCHAWGASPIYLLGKYALGVYPTEPGYKKYQVKPNLMSFKHFCGTVPTPNGTITVSCNEDCVTVLSQIDGGTLIIKDKKYEIKANEELRVSLN